MPELPEVETVRRQLEALIPQQETVTAVHLSEFSLRKPLTPKAKKQLVGAQFQSIQRIGKTLFFEFDRLSLENHLGMSGWWRSHEAGSDWSDLLQKHDHFGLLFSNNTFLIYNDARRFGWVKDLPAGFSQEVGGTGFPIDPTRAEIPFEALWKVTKKRDLPIKNLLMAQNLILGVGNIYASEILYRSAVKPGRAAKSLSRAELQKILQSTREIFEEAIQSGGSTIRNYKSVGGVSGGFQSFHQVYDFAGEPCRKCGAPIRSKFMSGRSTYWCSVCQK